MLSPQHLALKPTSYTSPYFTGKLKKIPAAKTPHPLLFLFTHLFTNNKNVEEIKVRLPVFLQINLKKPTRTGQRMAEQISIMKKKC